MNKLISIIVPIFNVGAYLEKCISSICSQTYKNIEIILVDDGSTDDSPKICESFADRDLRIRVIHKENEGLVRARKTGLEAATGDLIAYVDGDDWIEPGMFHKMYQVLNEQNVDIVMCGRYEDTGNTRKAVHHGIPAGRYDKDKLLGQVYPHMIVNDAFFDWGIFPGLWDKLFKRESIEEFQKQVDDRIAMGEDAACVYPALLNAESIYILHECFYHYRQSSSSMVKKIADGKKMRDNFNILYNSVNAVFKRQSYIYDLRKQWRDYLLFLMVPRAEVLYKGIENLDYLFPFKDVKRGSNIIIYGMGTYGQLLYGFVKRTGICNIVACADQNYKELSKQGIAVESPSDIEKYDYDGIVVAASFAKTRTAVYRYLTDKIPKDKVHVICEELIKSDESLEAFGLL